ncbi:uncharacterized protein MELLADRAFT_95448 [Melampsora larici-populina 98AG31]|uniref:Uncharacterized protein n=1 Tax=Melampsora larici-populina (strain 98AG31 / pathotype 3-4-7) TaxID=747676 RepID=F4S9C9_MELLP|nr:uncharacterized protein MELLADRAFT_95448 [Melampsora larici-populina 98AG31]EGF98752.1 hypothetical protein MELLADRAFT_95448 [Melampsora larici-populina 98AG31]
MGDDSRLIALTVFTAQCYQNLARQIEQLSLSQNPSNSNNTTNTNPTPTLTAPLPPWKPSEALTKLVVDAVFDFIGASYLQAYTDTEGILNIKGQKGTLTHSLEERVIDRVRAQDPGWKDINLPEVRAGAHTRFHKDVIALIKKKCKIGRENLHHILLRNAHPKWGSTSNALPTLSDLLVLVRTFFSSSVD